MPPVPPPAGPVSTSTPPPRSASPPPPPTPPPVHGWLDLPAWSAGDQLEITWLVSIVLDGKDPESSKFPVELVATIGGVSRRLTLKPQLGAVSPLN